MTELVVGVGSAIDFTGMTLPFNVSDLISSGSGLLGLVSGFVLLGLAFAFVPKIIAVIRSAFGKSKA